MIPYFSIIETPGSLIVFIVAACWCGYFASLAGFLMKFEKREYFKIFLIGFLAIVCFVAIVWIFIGDSTYWSEPIGLWLRGY